MEGSSDSKEIKRIARSLMEARNRLDSKELASFYAEDCEFMNVKGHKTTGRAALEESLRMFYATDFVKKTRQSIEDIQVKFVQPDIASLEIWWRTEGAVDLTGKTRRGVINAIMVKQPTEGWKVQVSHNTELIEGETSTIGVPLDQRRVQQMADSFSSDYKKRDFAKMASFFAEDAIYLPAGGRRVQGRENVEDYWRATSERGVEEFTIKVEKVHSAGSIAYEIGNATARIRTASGQLTTDSLRYVVVWRLEPDGEWRIVADLSNRETG